jgi:hypothetical protein
MFRVLRGRARSCRWARDGRDLARPCLGRCPLSRKPGYVVTWRWAYFVLGMGRDRRGSNRMSDRRGGGLLELHSKGCDLMRSSRCGTSFGVFLCLAAGSRFCYSYVVAFIQAPHRLGRWSRGSGAPQEKWDRCGSVQEHMSTRVSKLKTSVTTTWTWVLGRFHRWKLGSPAAVITNVVKSEKGLAAWLCQYPWQRVQLRSP